MLWNDIFHIVCKQAIILNFGKESTSILVDQTGFNDMMMKLLIQATMGLGVGTA